ncbi:putative dethiobiotin synthase [Enterobacter hormaechei subsp. xiangfangensis]|nr:putative dethiobiotin synthase [Enterobacter hormaechei subsp. xiangfangensis]
MLVEGAGGWFTPLSDEQTFADWVQAEQLSVILVVGVKLGCINHAMLTAQAVQQRGVPASGPPYVPRHPVRNKVVIQLVNVALCPLRPR